MAISVWVFGKSPTGDTLLIDLAVSYLDEYWNACGPVQRVDSLIPLIRLRLRHGVGCWSRLQADGHGIDHVNIEKMTFAFANLREIVLLL